MKVYIKFLLAKFIKTIIFISAIFFLLILILNIIEEINFFKRTDVDFWYPIFLNFLVSPSILIKIFPFIFLISTQFFILNLIEKNELITLKNFGISNLKLISIITLISMLLSLFIIIFFYNFSSKLKYIYLDLKNNYASDSKYLAVITENGLWIKDEINGETNIINAEKINGSVLKNSIISQFDKNFKILRYIVSDNINIENNNWIVNNPIIFSGNNRLTKNKIIFFTNFNSEKINNLFSDLEFLTIWDLHNLKNDYISVGYSVKNIELHLQKIYSYPFYISILVMFSSVIVLNIKHKKPKIFFILSGIFFSVIIFYLNHFSSILGMNGKIPLMISIWLPHLIVLIFASIGMVKVNEK